MPAALTITLSKFEPPDIDQWRRLTTAQRKEWFKLVGKHAVTTLRKRLLDGRDRHGKKFLRRLNPRPDGASGPPLSPHDAASRSVRLMSSRWTDKDATIYWEEGWGEILAYHQAGIPSRLGKRVRDVAGFTDKERVEIYNAALGEWKGPSKPARISKPAAKTGRLAEERIGGTGARVVKVVQGQTDTRFGTIFGGKTEPQPKPKPKAAVQEIKDPPPPPPVLPSPPPPPPPPTPPAPPANRLEAARLAQLERNRQLRAQAAPGAGGPATSPALTALGVDLRRAESEISRLKRLKAAAQARDAAAFDRAINMQEIAAAEARAKIKAEEDRLAAEAAADAALPERIPAGPIAERIKQYSYGDAKLEALAEAGKEWKEVRSRVEEINNEIDRLQVENRTAKSKVVAANTKRVKELQRERAEVQDRWDQARDAVAGKVREALELRDGPAVAVSFTDISPGTRAGASPAAPELQPGGRNPEVAARAAQAASLISGIARPGRGDPVVRRALGVASDVRAYCGKDHIAVSPEDGLHVFIHELGHALEHDLGVHARVKEFLNHRVGNEPLTPLSRLGTGYRDDEMGRKDNFDKVFDGVAAYYVGKEYPNGTEILSMGLEEMFRDPAGFAAKDPEFAKFVVGILDGSLR